MPTSAATVPATQPQSTAATAAAECCTPLTAPRLGKPEAEALAELLKALADPARIRLVNLLATSPDPICVCNLTAPLGLSQPTVSHHLRKLREVGLVHAERRGTWAYYSLDRDALRRLASLVDVQPEPAT